MAPVAGMNNKPVAGGNYGWPVVSYGINYSGRALGSGDAVRGGFLPPVYYWDPVIAPAGMMFYDGNYGPWQGDLLIGSLNPGGIVRLKLENGRVAGEERLRSSRPREIFRSAGRWPRLAVAGLRSDLQVTPVRGC